MIVVTPYLEPGGYIAIVSNKSSTMNFYKYADKGNQILDEVAAELGFWATLLLILVVVL